MYQGDRDPTPTTQLRTLITLMSPIKQLKCQLRSTLQMVNTGLTLSSCLHTPVSRMTGPTENQVTELRTFSVQSFD
jgi:hypothetical protein